MMQEQVKIDVGLQPGRSFKAVSLLDLLGLGSCTCEDMFPQTKLSLRRPLY